MQEGQLSNLPKEQPYFSRKILKAQCCAWVNAILVDCAGLNDREMTSLQAMFIEDSLEVFVAEHTFAIRFVPALTIGYHRRTSHAVRIVRSALAKVPNCKIEVLDNTLTAKTTDLNKPDLLNAVDLARQRLEQFGAEKITAKAV